MIQSHNAGILQMLSGFGESKSFLMSGCVIKEYEVNHSHKTQKFQIYLLVNLDFSQVGFAGRGNNFLWHVICRTDILWKKYDSETHMGSGYTSTNLFILT